MPLSHAGGCDVLVVGAGPIGLVLGCHLRRLGMSVRIVEKRDGPSLHSKAIGLQYRVSEILARLGVIDRFIAQSGSPTTVNIYAGGQRLVRLQFVAPEGVSGTGAFVPCALVIPQSQTESILVDYFRELGGTLEWETECIGYRQDGSGVSVDIRTRDGATETVRSAWLVSCEGAHSTVRKQAGLTFRGKTYPLALFMADVHLQGTLSHKENHVWVHPDGSLAALPLPTPDTWRLFIEVTRQDNVQETMQLDDVRRLMAERAPDMDAKIVGDALWLSPFRINCRMADRMRDGRVFLAGDAAHVHSPTGGQGITTGMQDACNLAWKLARVSGGAPMTLLDTYDEERLPHIAEVLRETNRTTTLLFAPNLMLRAVRDIIVLPILRNRWVQRMMFGKFSQLHVHYRASSLSADSRPRSLWLRHRLRAGDRAPDVRFRMSTGNCTLFELMASLRPLVLVGAAASSVAVKECVRQLDVDGYVVRPATSVDPTDPSDLVDINGDFARLYGIRNNYLCVIRPDGHVGAIFAATDRSSLRQYLLMICNEATVSEAFGSSLAASR